MVAGFSRLQLAAALLEYDNDPDNPDAPKRSAHESAIFANFRRYLPSNAPKKNDYIGVSLPGDDAVSTRRPHSIVRNRQSKVSVTSISTLQNPFRPDDQIDEEDEEQEGLEVDLASWGLDAFMPEDKEKGPKNSKGKSKSTEHPTPHPISSVPSHQPLASHDATPTVPRRALGASRSMSVGGNLEYFGTHERSTFPSARNRRRSMGATTLDAETQIHPQRRRASSYTALTPTAPIVPQLTTIPTASMSLVSNQDHAEGVPFPSGPSRFESSTVRERSVSNAASVDSKLLLTQNSTDERQRMLSTATVNTRHTIDDNPFALEPPTTTSRFDPKGTTYRRTMSNASMMSRAYLEEDTTPPDQPFRESRYTTTLELLRPKVLVMPSPLQGVSTPVPPPPENVRDGFQLSTDGPPLPPGAKSARRSSISLFTSDLPPVASNSFTPNPLAAMSLSQKTFRNTLRVGAEGDAYDIGNLPRATEEGEQIRLDEDEEIPEIDVMPDLTDAGTGARPPGKLYGKSLIDTLEERKAEMRNKQRVFYGDERPSMMARRPAQRQNTLIDPSSLQTRPTSQHMSGLGFDSSTDLKRRNSANIKPLLNFDEENKPVGPAPRLPPTRSVFGVDTLWEREMAKLREIESQEKIEEEERRRQEEAAEVEKNLKKKKKHKGKKKVTNTSEPEPQYVAAETFAQPRVSLELPVLPDIQRAPRRTPRPVPDEDSESEDDGNPRSLGVVRGHSLDPEWHAISSDEEDGPRRTTGTGPRYLNKARHLGNVAQPQSDDEDLPLSIAVRRAGNKPAILNPSGAADSDDEKPLSSIFRGHQPGLLPEINFDKQQEEEDDDKPLGLRVSRINSGGDNDDDDDRPLAYHPEQQRRTQYQMMMAQQQQMMFQAQAQMSGSVYIPGMPMMGTPFFPSPMMPMMMQAPMPIPSPPPMHDDAKFGRVDRWRHNVATQASDS